LENLGGTRLTRVYIVLDALEGYVELREQEPDLVAVPRGQVVVQADHAVSYGGGT